MAPGLVIFQWLRVLYRALMLNAEALLNLLKGLAYAYLSTTMEMDFQAATFNRCWKLCH